MTYPPRDPNQPDPTRPFQAPQPYDPYRAPPVSGQPYQAPPVVSGQPYQQAYPQPPARPYGAPPPGFYPPQTPPRKKGSGKIIVLIVAVIAGLCLVGGVINAVTGGNTKAKSPGSSVKAPGVSGQPAKEDEPAEKLPSTFNVKLGTTLTIKDFEGTQEVTIKSAKTFKKGCESFSPDPEQGVYVVLDVLVMAKAGTVSVNSLWFNWEGQDGTSANALSGAFSGCEKNDLGTTNDLRPGQKRAGQVTFDASSAKGSVEYRQLGSDTAGSWKVG
jgi:hypothetical protein